MTGRVHDLERHVGDLENPAVLHLDVGLVLGMGLPPRQPVLAVQGHRRLVPLGHLERRGDVIGMAVRADDREHLPVARPGKHRLGIAARIDDDDLFVVADQPDVDRRVPAAVAGDDS